MNEPLSPGQVPDGVRLPPWIKLAAAAVLMISALTLAFNWQTLHIYRKYFTQPQPDAIVPWQKLSAEMDEAAALASMPGLPWRCVRDETRMGQRTCYTSARRINGHAAMTVAMFFNNGRLRVVTVHVPWWAHREATLALVRDHGKSMGRGRAAGSDESLLGWRMAGGDLAINRQRSLNPLQWSALVWAPRSGAEVY